MSYAKKNVAANRDMGPSWKMFVESFARETHAQYKVEKGEGTPKFPYDFLSCP